MWGHPGRTLSRPKSPNRCRHARDYQTERAPACPQTSTTVERQIGTAIRRLLHPGSWGRVVHDAQSLVTLMIPTTHVNPVMTQTAISASLTTDQPRKSAPAETLNS